MNHTMKRGWPLAGLLVLFLAGQIFAQAPTPRIQTIALKAGWNAVFLQVEPMDTTPAKVFAGLPVGIVATYFASDQAVEFVTDPASIQWNRTGWGVWYAPGRPDAFLSTLFAVNVNRGYLVYVERDCTWTIEGVPLLQPIRWKSDSFNLVGFSLDAVAPPTFARFFKGSPAHRMLKAYRLVNGRWSLVIDPATSLMKDGEAFWVYCSGGSEYQGPVSVNLPGAAIIFPDRVNVIGVGFKSACPDPVGMTLFPPTGPLTVPLACRTYSITTNGMVEQSIPLTAPMPLNTMESGERRELRLELRRELMTEPVQSGILKVTTDLGTVHWLSVTGKRSSLATP